MTSFSFTGLGLEQGHTDLRPHGRPVPACRGKMEPGASTGDRRSSLGPSCPPTRHQVETALGFLPRNGRWQVFGLTSASAFAGFLGFVASRYPRGPSACDEV